MTQTKPNSIVALCIISESEITKVLPDYHYSFEFDKPNEFKAMLHELGVDTNQPYERQDNVMHRNRFNEIVHCSRWVGNERTDEEWINSGYASREAIDKSSGSKILESLYREKGLTEDAQESMRSRDKYAEQTEEENA
jgi:hypothetical protein